MSSTAPLWLLLSALLSGCTGLPRYGVPLPPLPTAAAAADDAFTLPDGARLPLRAWLPPTATPPAAIILALHGFNDSRNAWEIPGPALAAAGIAVFAPDQRGFGAAPGRGTWPGAPRLADDAAAMLGTLRARYPGTPLFAMGESMGGAILMTLAARPDAPKLDGWILLSPAVWGPPADGARHQRKPLARRRPGPRPQRHRRRNPPQGHGSDNREALIRLARDPLTIRRTRFDTLRGLTDLMDAAQDAAPRLDMRLHGPVLALYGSRDTLVPEDATARAWTRMPPDAERPSTPPATTSSSATRPATPPPTTSSPGPETPAPGSPAAPTSPPPPGSPPTKSSWNVPGEALQAGGHAATAKPPSQPHPDRL